MELGLSGKTAMVLGAAGGLGGAMARKLHAEGAKVALVDLSEEGLEVIAGELGPERTMKVVWNLAETDQIDQKVREIEARLGPVDVLVNNTGGPPPTKAEGQDEALWRSNFESMVLSVIKLTDRVLPGMKKSGWGRVITSTSSGVVAPIPNLAVSNALRMSLVGWSKTLAKEVGRDGITCNVVLPGRIATRRIVQLDAAKAEREGRSVEEVSKESTASIAVGRYGEPDEYGNVVAFLASTAASYVTGSVIRIDGGLIASA